MADTRSEPVSEGKTVAKKKGNHLGSLRRRKLMHLCRGLGFENFSGLPNAKVVELILAARPEIPHRAGEAKKNAIRVLEWFDKNEVETYSRGEKPTVRPELSKPSFTAKDLFYRSWEWRTLRMEVIKQFGAVCQCCGARPGDKTVGGDRVRICVDHIVPLSKRWDLRLERSNLQILCDECNQGKGAWDETDFRPETGVDPQIGQKLRYVI